MSKSVDMEQAIIFHKIVDKKWGLESPNNTWPPFLIDYYNAKEIKENEKENT